ncbi:hypothetical protein [Dongshaea marina]|uniref:hypothetical protein n=1 Tax=Dongshaea marina TaxID=2047966 RepID=UPI000D3E3226|nr:hypothetical protein [Dongshaea marina]
MKQSELEHFVTQLAQAEQAAAQTIQQAELKAEQRLEALLQTLEQEHQEAFNELQQKLQQEKQCTIEELKQQAIQLERETNTRIERFRQGHQAQLSSLVDWLVKRIIDA